jgi:hypothetical protein
MKKLIFFALALMLMPMAFAAITTYSYHSFDEGSVNITTLNDTSGNGVTLIGTQGILKDGVIGESVYYGGDTNNYSQGVNALFNKSADWSISLWANFNFSSGITNSFYSISNSSANWLLFLTNNPPEYNLIFGCRDTDNMCNGTLAGAWNPSEITSLQLTNLTWHFITYAYQDNSTTLKLCVDAVCTETDYELGDTAYPVSQIYLGWGVIGGSFPANAFIDELGVYDVYLNDEEITTLYNEGNGCQYPFDSCGVAQEITIISPADHAMSDQMLDIAYNITIDDTCSLYVNDLLNQTDAAVENSTEQYFNVTDMYDDGTYDYYINCSGNLSTEQHYHLHADSPLIQMFQPNHDNSTIFTSFSLSWIGNITNTNLTYVNETIRNSTSDIVYSNETITSTTFLDLAKTIDATAWGNGYYYYHIYANDELDSPSEEYISFQIDVCIPAWVCSGYDACFANDTQACNAVTDTNVCGEAYGGDYSEFPAQSCNYCTATATTSVTHFGNTTCQYDLLMTNWAACCNVTQLGSDCLYTFTTPPTTANFTATDSITVFEACSAYLATYAVADLDNIFADMLGTTGAVFVAFIGLIVLVLIGVWAYRKIKGG